MCKKESETNIHIFVRCEFARQCWQTLTQTLSEEWREERTIQETIMSWGNRSKNKKERKLRIMMQAHLQWQIWKERNSKIFEGKESEASQVLRMAIIRTIENVSNASPRTMGNNYLLPKLGRII